MRNGEAEQWTIFVSPSRCDVPVDFTASRWEMRFHPLNLWCTKPRLL
jgi:hypothetical protein